MVGAIFSAMLVLDLSPTLFAARCVVTSVFALPDPKQVRCQMPGQLFHLWHCQWSWPVHGQPSAHCVVWERQQQHILAKHPPWLMLPLRLLFWFHEEKVTLDCWVFPLRFTWGIWTMSMVIGFWPAHNTVLAPKLIWHMSKIVKLSFSITWPRRYRNGFCIQLHKLVLILRNKNNISSQSQLRSFLASIKHRCSRSELWYPKPSKIYKHHAAGVWWNWVSPPGHRWSPMILVPSEVQLLGLLEFLHQLQFQALQGVALHHLAAKCLRLKSLKVWTREVHHANL